jgi:YbbR domain-containing protein
VAPLFTRHLGVKALSLAVALAAWLVTFNLQSETVTRSIRAPVLFEHVADDRIVRKPDPAEVRIAVSGPRLQLERLESEGVNVLVDVSEAREGLNRHFVADREIALPKGVTARDVQPGVVTFKVERLVDVQVPVSPKTTGRLPKGLWLEKISANPARVKLRLPRSRASLGNVVTDAVPLNTIRESSEVKRDLVLPEGIELARGEASSVTVVLKVGGRLP